MNAYETTMQSVANAISELDAKVGALFMSRPFHRDALMAAFLAGCKGSRYESYSLLLSDNYHAAKAIKVAA